MDLAKLETRLRHWARVSDVIWDIVLPFLALGFGVAMILILLKAVL
jgi:hypothetical protein